MILTVKPAPQLKGTLLLPASKSYSIRAFIIAACGGNSQIIHPSDCDDALVALRAAKHLGAAVGRKKAGIFSIHAGQHPVDLKKINVGESGTVLRFLLPIVALFGQPAAVIGEGTLRGRPNAHLIETLRRQGIDLRGTAPQGSVPIYFKGGKLHGGKIEIEGSVSSQFVSALLIACAQLKSDSQIVLQGTKIVSLDYITMTCQILQKAGIKIRRIHDRLYTIPGGQRFRGLKNFVVPADYGLAAFLLGAGILTKSNLQLKGNLKNDLLQADGRILEFLRRMGVKFQKTSAGLTFNGPARLIGGTFSLKDCPDLVPIMAVLAMFAQGRTRLCDIGHAKVKESDRMGDLRRELLKAGARISQKATELIIDPLPEEKYKRNVSLDPHHDHRLAMAFGVLGVKLGARIKDIECVSKSYPQYVRDMKRLGAKVSNS